MVEPEEEPTFTYSWNIEGMIKRAIELTMLDIERRTTARAISLRKKFNPSSFSTRFIRNRTNTSWPIKCN